MPIIKRAKTTFTAGELAPELLGRGDVPAWSSGAMRLRNMFIQPTGGVERRPGLRHLSMLPGAARLVPFEFSTEQAFLLVLLEHGLRIFRGDEPVAEMNAPWTAAMLPQIAFTQDGGTLLLLHPAMPPQAVRRNDAGHWVMTPFAFAAQPFFRYAPGSVSLTPSGTAGVVSVTASENVFLPGHVGAQLRIGVGRLSITAVNSASMVTAQILEAPASMEASTAWQESAFSAVRGWPVSACFHQARLVLGGSRDLPNRLWFSRTARYDNFDPGEGLDDEAIEFGLVSDQLNAIRAVFAGRHLQVFTSGAEWMVSGDPLTPSSIQVTRQTRVGSPVERSVPPLDVDGSTVFVARSGRAVHEFSYTDLQQAYQAEDLALVARHLMRAPVSMAYDSRRRLLHLAMQDGSLATLTIYRAEAVTGWTRQETDGAFHSLAEMEGTVYAVVERGGRFRLERFDDALRLDAAVPAHGSADGLAWSGLDHLEGRAVALLADGAPRDRAVVLGGVVTLDAPAGAVQAGLPFTHVVEPMPPETSTGTGARMGPVRLVAITFRLLETGALSVDTGRGSRPVPFRRLDTPMLDAAPPLFTGDVTLRGLGWRRNSLAPLWRIEGDAPLAFTLLSVTTETRTTD
ncbi:hypothetical protein J8J14_17880 [Roseomonas sp. SSH11]|uniref:Uncharacterized protein n=1 Tax=Pararoseomonas baculiformis TaxID=2820812 RepID=A0ABS4AJF5_9PROT|nr:hypothetical protein [Pararoseomonas baculiformis]MBP0446648.1 hypothetical protein [Pararoseomonas baculiformis]